MNPPRPYFSGWPLWSLIAVAVLAMTGLSIASQADLVEGVHSAVRATARSSFALFLLACCTGNMVYAAWLLWRGPALFRRLSESLAR